MHITLHKALKNAIKTGLISRNPIDLVDPPKVERHEMKTMTEEDNQVYLTACFTFIFGYSKSRV
jgi:hypothetical protein